MNGNFYQNPTFPSNSTMTPTIPQSPPGNISSMSQLTMEQSFIENILRLNKGKRVNAYVSYLTVVSGKTKFTPE